MKMKLLWHGAALRGIVLLSLIGLPAFALACRCAGQITPKAAYEQADLVVTGTAVKVSGDPYGPGGATVQFEVDEAWKHETTRTITIETSTTCAFDFRTGKRFLLFLQRSTDEKRYVARACQGNLPASDANDVRAWLTSNGRPCRVDPDP